MHLVMFYHSLISDWNHGNAHFLRGIAGEFIARGHRVSIYEPHDGWSLTQLRSEHGESAVAAFTEAYPLLFSRRYSLETLDLDRVLDTADVVIAHEWNTPELIRRLGEQRAASRRFRLFFHDTHHRSATAPHEMAGYDLRHFDGALVFGQVIKETYQRHGWCERVFVWHEAADTRVFHPLPDTADGELVWIGNWGDEERTAELHEYLIEPVKALGLRGRVHGVRYPQAAQRALDDAGLSYAGWLPNYRAPATYARFQVTLHVPRRPYASALPGIPTIRVFEALACGIPLICAPWEDTEHLFSPGDDYLIARDGREMQQHLRALLSERERALHLSEHGRRTVLARHTCAHRVDELLELHRGLAA